jgi:L-asparagine oxygenase
MKAIDVDFVFSEEENAKLTTTLNQINISPYTDYGNFRVCVNEIIKSNQHILNGFSNLCFHKKKVNQYEDPYVFLKNCPVDPSLPFLDFENPVEDKRNRKKTYVAEAFLELYAQIMGQEPISYINVNDGDIFQDIHPMKKLIDSQSQKASKTIYFHKDLANHFVRPDWVNILGLRASKENEIYTSFVRNKDLLNYLDDDLHAVLREPVFFTPYDDLTLSSSNKKLGHAPNHPILGVVESYDIRFFENRTEGVTDQAKEAVEEIIKALHALKQNLHILKGDFIGSANNECLHNKEVIRIGDEAAVNNRWLMKTVNVKYLDLHKAHMCEGEIRIVNG